MSFSPTPNALRVEIKPSNYFRIVLIGIALVALAAILYAQLAWLLRVPLAIFIFIYTYICWRDQLHQRGILHWQSSWLWHDADDKEHRLRLLHATAWPGLVVLNFRDLTRKRNFTLTLLADSFGDADSARQLRVYLNHFPVFDSADIAK